ncbi:F0F1 ATP synthase subunit delta [Candidatus Uhrbacteria bacterium]|nr:F0F1 ATP synthase subunit delta [Candidatus Uhrbacteria bacterium]
MRYTATQYATALRAVAADLSTFQQLLADLRAVHERCAGDRAAWSFFVDRNAEPTAQERVLRTVFQDFLSDRTYQFLVQLFRDHQFAQLPRILTIAERMEDGETGSVRVEVVSAVSIPEPTRATLDALLMEKLGRRPISAYAVDPACIGGLRVTIDATRAWDGTVAGKLEQLRVRLRSI